VAQQDSGTPPPTATTITTIKLQTTKQQQPELYTFRITTYYVPKFLYSNTTEYQKRKEHTFTKCDNIEDWR
jgi:hypothetical protein